MNNIETRLARLEERQNNLELDVKEIKSQLNETAKRSDVQELRETLEARDQNYTRNLWRLVFVLIIVFTGILMMAVGLKVSDLPTGLF